VSDTSRVAAFRSNILPTASDCVSRMNKTSIQHDWIHHCSYEESRKHSLTLQTPTSRRYRRGADALLPLGLPHARQRASRVVPPQHAAAVPRPDRGAETLRECDSGFQWRLHLSALPRSDSCVLAAPPPQAVRPLRFRLSSRHVDLPHSVLLIPASQYASASTEPPCHDATVHRDRRSY
jgi:hypothetical protein